MSRRTRRTNVIHSLSDPPFAADRTVCGLAIPASSPGDVVKVEAVELQRFREYPLSDEGFALLREKQGDDARRRCGNCSKLRKLAPV